MQLRNKLLVYFVNRNRDYVREEHSLMSCSLTHNGRLSQNVAVF